MGIRSVSLEVVWSNVLTTALDVTLRENAFIATLAFLLVVVCVNRAWSIARVVFLLLNA